MDINPAIRSMMERDSILLAWELRALFFVTLLYLVSFCFYCGSVLWPDSRFGRVASRMLLAGVVIHLIAITLRIIEAGRPPHRTLFEILLTFTCMAAITYIFVEKRFRYIFIAGAPLAGICGGLCLYAILKCDPGNVPSLPAFQSELFVWHVLIILISFAVLTVAFSVECGYIVLTKLIPLANLSKYCRDIGTAARFHRVTHQLALFAFPLLTCGIALGVAWGIQAYGRYWSWCPRETWSLISWFVYALYLHSMTLLSWRSGGASILKMAGFGCILIALLYMGQMSGLSSITSFNTDMYSFW